MANHLSDSVHSETGIRSDAAALLFTDDVANQFGVICKQYERRLFLVSLRILRNQADAEDAVQEALLRAYTKLDGFRGDAAVYTWLVRIVINTSLMMLRKRTRHVDTPLDWIDEDGRSLIDILPAAGISVETEVIEKQRHSIMHAAIASLPPKFSGILVEWITEERTMDELSRQFAITIPAAKSRMLRAKKKIVQAVNRRLKPSTRDVARPAINR